jgi:hypothetical protein
MAQTIHEWVRVVLGHRNLFLVLQEIRAARKTGSLTIQFSQGSIGSLEWQQKRIELGIWPFAKRTSMENVNVHDEESCATLALE